MSTPQIQFRFSVGRTTQDPEDRRRTLTLTHHCPMGKFEIAQIYPSHRQAMCAKEYFEKKQGVQYHQILNTLRDMKQQHRHAHLMNFA